MPKFLRPLRRTLADPPVRTKEQADEGWERARMKATKRIGFNQTHYPPDRYAYYVTTDGITDLGNASGYYTTLEDAS